MANRVLLGRTQRQDLMGRLNYNSSTGTDFDDRLLAHLQIVIGTKLGRGEGFYLSWKNTLDVGSGRRSIWLHPSIPLEFTFAGNRSPRINPAWVRQLVQDSYTVNGLRITPEADSDVGPAQRNSPQR